MTKLSQVYKCSICGNVTEVLHTGAGALVCCGKEMNLLKENTTDAATEKHVPVIEKTNDGILVKVGSTTHPMEEKHYIEWIELLTENQVYRKHLKPGEKPEALFKVNASSYVARELCNLHGLWKGEL